MRYLLCLVAALTMAFSVPHASATAQTEQLVLAFYYAWYDEKTWTPDKVPDMPLTPYRSADRATIERHVREAKEAGIDAFVQSWYGPGNNQTESNFATLLDVARSGGMQATVDFEVASPFMPDLNAVVDGLRHLIRVHASHPAFLRYRGQPVIFFWRQQRYDQATWAQVRKQVDPERHTIWIAEGDDPAWLDVFDGLHLYSITWRVNTNPAYTASKMRKRVDTYNAGHDAQRLWVATVMPGYDDTHIAGRQNTFVYPRSPEYYRSTWEAAIASRPEMIIINSYNEWREGTMIEPSVTYGNTYLDLTREMAARYKGPLSPTVTPAPTLTPSPTATPLPQPTPTPSSTPIPSPSPTFTFTPTATPTATPVPSFTPTRTPSPTPTTTPSPTPSPSSTPTVTPLPPPTLAPSPTPGPPPSPTPAKQLPKTCPAAIILPVGMLIVAKARKE